MKHAETVGSVASQISRLVLMAGSVVLVAQVGLKIESRSLANDGGRRSSAAATDDKSDQEKMQGKWKITRCEFSGREMDQTVGVEDTISDAKWLRPQRRTSEYQLKFDASKDPKWVDLSAERLGDKSLKGIYKLEGDKLTICYAYNPDSPRPADFKTDADVASYLYVLERVKKE